VPVLSHDPEGLSDPYVIPSTQQLFDFALPSVRRHLPVSAALASATPFAFQTIETIVLDPGHVLIANDNNYPFSLGRHTGTGAADDDELIVLKLARPADR
jgi:hypothetical protein